VGYDCYVVDQNGDTVDIEGGYYRRNIFGMGPQRDRFEAVGMGYWPQGDRGDFPDRPEGVDWNDQDELVGPGADEYQAAVSAHLKDTCDERPGICLDKLCSNDGWWVTKVECESALKLWEQAGEPELDDYGDTIPFLRVAAAYCGFRVY